MSNNNTPICKLIFENIVDGRLKKGFRLPTDEDEKNFGDGTIDSMALFHVKPAIITDEIKNRVKEALIAVSDGDNAKADDIFAELGSKVMMVNLVVTIQETILNNKEILNPANIMLYAVNTLSNSTNKECVKAALIILSIIKQDDNIKYLVNIVALCDEFTYYAILSILRWENKSEALMDLGKRVSGWGRIHVVRTIAPETDEIKEWLLEDGINNKVHPAYSAYTVFSKTDVEDRLDNKRLRYPEFHSILRLFDCMLDENPVKNISLIETKDRERLFLKLFEQADFLSPLEQEDYIMLAHINAWLQSMGENTDEIAAVSAKVMK